MSDILFSQLCLRVPPATAPSFGDDVQHDRNLNLTCVVYMALVGTFPFNFLLSRVLSCVVEFKSAASSSTHPCNDSNKVIVRLSWVGSGSVSNAQEYISGVKRDPN
ncbi:hypothetical protein QL285_093760 [Trifolium repens]|nr:hypothetical protein QL285_093760 [Trifolium repens]